MSKSIDEVVTEIKFLRMSLIPPYCEDHDEDEKDVAAYEQHFAALGRECKDAAQSYLEALTRLSTSLAEEPAATTELLEARARFAASFPFCVDELPDLKSHDAHSYIDHMMEAYHRDVATGFLAKAIAQYIDLLDQVI